MRYDKAAAIIAVIALLISIASLFKKILYG